MASGTMCEAKMHYAEVVDFILYLHYQKCLWFVKRVSIYIVCSLTFGSTDSACIYRSLFHHLFSKINCLTFSNNSRDGKGWQMSYKG